MLDFHVGEIMTVMVFVCFLYLYFFKCVKLPSKECANVVLASLGPAPLWVKAAELVSSPPPYLCCTHSLAPAHNISSMYFQSGVKQP